MKFEQAIERDGFKLRLRGTWYEISNKYGILDSGDVALSPYDIPDSWAENKMEDFTLRHTVKVGGTIKMVSRDLDGDYLQLQAYEDKHGGYMLQVYDKDMTFRYEEWVACETCESMKAYMRMRYRIVSGLRAEVLRDSLADCTNGGISSRKDTLYMVDGKKYPFEPCDIRECVSVKKIDVMGSVHVYASPLYRSEDWYMAGGNFLYTGDGRYKDMTGISYPISIHDRCEDR